MFKRFCKKIQKISTSYKKIQSQPITINIVQPINNRVSQTILLWNTLHCIANPCLASLLIVVMSCLFYLLYLLYQATLKWM